MAKASDRLVSTTALTGLEHLLVLQGVGPGSLKRVLLNTLLPKGAPVQCTTGGSANNISLAPVALARVDYTTQQRLTFSAPAGLSSGTVMISTPGANGGVACELLLPSGASIPAGAWTGATPITICWKPTTLKWVLESPSWMQQLGTLELVQSNADGRTIVADLKWPGTKTPGSVAGAKVSFRAKANKQVGAASLTVTGIFAIQTIFARDGVSSPGENYWLQDDVVHLEGMAAGNWRVVRVDTRTATTAEAAAGVDDYRPVTSAGAEANWWAHAPTLSRILWAPDNQPLSTSRPTRFQMPEAGRIVIDMKPPAAAYRDGFKPAAGDYVRFEMTNLAGPRYHNYAMDTMNLWEVTGIWTCFGGIMVPQSNWSFQQSIGAGSNSGSPFSTVAAVMFIGKLTDPVAVINAALGSGPGHGNIKALTFALNTVGAYRNGQPLADGTNVLSVLKVFDVVECQEVLFNSTWAYLTPDGTTAAVNTIQHRFAPATGHQLSITQALQCQAGMGITGGYMNLFVTRNPDRCSVRSVADAVTGPFDIGTGDASTLGLGQARRVLFWNSDHDAKGHCLQGEIDAGVVPFKQNGVVQPYDVARESFIIRNAEARKWYQPSHVDNSTLEDVSGLLFETKTYLDGVRALAA